MAYGTSTGNLSSRIWAQRGAGSDGEPKLGSQRPGWKRGGSL